MKRTIALPLAAALLLAGGCSGEGESTADETLSEAAVTEDAQAREAISEASDDPGFDRESEYGDPPSPVIPVPGGEGTVVTGSLQPVGTARVAGSLSLAAVEGGTYVTIQVTEAPAAVPLVAELRTGACSDDAPLVRELGSLTVNAEGFSVLTDTLAIPPGEVMDGEHVITVRVAEGDRPPVACAPVPRNEPAGP